jgi:hypothetical protein
LSKGKDAIDLDVPLATSAGRPIGNKAATATALEEASTEKIQSSIKKCLIDVSSNLFIRYKKADERWAVLLQKQKKRRWRSRRSVLS